LNVVSADYQFMVERKDGRIESCGIHISAALQGPESGVLGFQGSINSIYMVDRIPAVLAKAVLVTPQTDTVVRLPLYGAAYQGDNVDTFKLRQLEGEYQSRMIVAQMDENPDEFMMLAIGTQSGYRVFLTADPKKRDLTFKLPSMSDVVGGDSTMSQYLECDSSASESWISEMDEQLRTMSPE
tara:strand:+ start:1048 stop:1596 length:549 start_codon:yes stop_codon:yes gene_type:complete